MSRLRPTLVNAKSGSRSPDTYDSLTMIRDAVERRQGLIHGKLETSLGVCAIGAFFADNPGASLSPGLVDQVAAYNDSIPRYITMQERRNKVLQWLNDRLSYLRIGIPRRAEAARREKIKAVS